MITVQWDNEEHTIIRYDVIGHWTWDEYHDALMQAIEWMNSVSYTVDVIADFKQSKGIPSGALTKTREAFSRAPANMGIVVFASGGALVDMLVFASRTAISKIALRLFTAPSLTAARALIKQKAAPEKLHEKPLG